MSKAEAYPSKITGVILIKTPRFEDDRGYFEVAADDSLLKMIQIEQFVQDNVSMSFQGVLRGMHIQRENPQGKLVRCLHGAIWDCWVDLRPESRTFKKWECLTLTSREDQQEMRPDAVYLPPGLAHGFLSLSPTAVVHYKCTTPYHKESDGGIFWRDKDLGIEWPFPEDFTPTISAKDANLPSLGEYLKQMR